MDASFNDDQEVVDATNGDATPEPARTLSIMSGSTSQPKKKPPNFASLVGTGYEYCREYMRKGHPYAVTAALSAEDKETERLYDAAIKENMYNHKAFQAYFAAQKINGEVASQVWLKMAETMKEDPTPAMVQKFCMQAILVELCFCRPHWKEDEV